MIGHAIAAAPARERTIPYHNPSPWPPYACTPSPPAPAPHFRGAGDDEASKPRTDARGVAQQGQAPPPAPGTPEERLRWGINEVTKTWTAVLAAAEQFKSAVDQLYGMGFSKDMLAELAKEVGGASAQHGTARLRAHC